MPLPDSLDPAKLNDDEVMLVSKDLERALEANPTASEMFRMANAQKKPEHRILTLRKAIWIVLNKFGEELRQSGALNL